MKPLTLTKLSFSLLLLIAGAACSKKDSAPISSNQPPSQSPEPMAMFTVSNTDLRAPVAIKFTNTSQNADNYLWEFGDGTSSTEAEPEKVFANGGTYTVKLTASKAGKSDVLSKTVNIDNAFNLMYMEKITIASIQLNGYETVLDGGPQPDVYIRMSANGQSRSSDVMENVSSISDLSWDVSLPIPITSDFSFKIEIMDKDNLSPDDVMGSVEIRPADYITIDNRYPEVITKTGNGLTIQLKVNWQFSPR